MDYYTNSGQLWSSQEEEQLKKEYNENNLDINEIGRIHKRTPGGIGSRLCILSIIENRVLARGYTKYRNSDLYREICEKGSPKKEKRPKVPKEKRPENSFKKKGDIYITIKQSDYNDLKEDITEIKEKLEEITEIKLQLNKIKKMIKKLTIYDFDDKD